MTLAERIFGARDRALLEEEELVALLESCWRAQDWHPKFPRERSWIAMSPDVLDVFDVIESPAARHALAMAGFREVRLHPHPARQIRSCACRPVRTEPA